VRLLPLLLLLLTNAVWGSTYVVAKVALEEIPPPLLASLRFTLAAVTLAAIYALRSPADGKRRLPPVSDTARLLGLGVLGIGMNGLLGFWGVSLTTASDAALLIVGEVLFTMLLAILIAREHLSPPRRLGLVCGVLGVIVLIGGGVGTAVAGAPARALGDILILAGLAFEAVHTVVGTRLTQRYDPVTVLMLTVGGSCLVWLPMIGWYIARGELSRPSPQATAGVLYLALVTSVVCYLIWFSVLRRAGATLGALSLLAQPLVGASLGIALLGDPVTLSTLVGGACVVVCMLLASLPTRQLRRGDAAVDESPQRVMLLPGRGP
jgi:drug/metabolite transporter (DMT)-like permease